MDRPQEYIVNSLEQHLFFARIMKEHALFLTAGLLPPNADLAEEGKQFIFHFEELLSQAADLSGQMVRRCVLDSGELVTDLTLCAEEQTQCLTSLAIDRCITTKILGLTGKEESSPCPISPALLRQVRRLNREAMALTEQLIDYKERILRGLTDCKLFTPNYPLLIEHILREARLYLSHLRRIEGAGHCSCREVQSRELFWNRIMMEHAQFIRGLLDPTEEKLIAAANDFAMDYEKLLRSGADSAQKAACKQRALTLTKEFRDFKCDGAKGIGACQIRSVILPLLADHVLREANHYIRLLES